MGLSRCVAILLGAGAGLLIPGSAQADAVPTSIFAWPFQDPDPEKPMCIGVQTTIWGDGKGNYTGACRYGAPLGPMQAAIKTMDRRTAVGRAREGGLAERFGIRLETELNTIAGLPMVTGRNRLKRYAQLETRAADDKGDQGQQGDPPAKPSWLRRAAVNCAIWGAIAATGENLATIIIKRKRPDSDVIKAAAIGCSLAVISPPVSRWIKSKGYDMEA
jgi:hypothetical protein